MRRALVLGLAALGCGATPAAPPAPSRALFEPAALTDTNPDPDVVEVELVATTGTAQLLDGKTTPVWGYRDGARADSAPSIPGPMLRAKVGDQIVVHFKNELPADETTIHWHGLRLPPESDGTPSTMSPVPPGGSFDYRFTARDAGSFWYHPHVRGYDQLERGLYAPVVFAAPTTPDVAADRYLVLDDIKLDADGALNAQTTDLDRMMGRQGNVLLVNGGRAPRVLHVAPGSRERWRFVDAANGRYFNLRLPGARFLVIATDGGLLAAPYETDTLLVTPGERYDVLVTFDGALAGGGVLQNVYYDRGHDLPDVGPQDLLTVVADLPAGAPPAPLPTTWGERPRLPVDAATPVRPFVLAEYEQPGIPVSFTINGERWPDNKPVHVHDGELEVWEVRNDAPMDHPFHLHGMFFEVLPAGDAPPVPDGWKDTVNVPQKSTVRLAVRYGPVGMWMFHCHILEHAELGMMGDLMVMPADAPLPAP
jgi:FtsP/CotA-like multicopper oxidase with cupredoxin domain